jgi:hypothetical protein
MTEAEWLACTDPQPMLEFLRGKASDRKLRLFACACCRSVPYLLADWRSQRAVEVAERVADGLAGQEELAEAHQAAERTHFLGAWQASHAGAWEASCRAARWAAKGAAYPAAKRAARAAKATGAGNWAAVHRAALDAALASARTAQAALLRDIIANPFRPPPPLASAVLAYSGGAVPRLAEPIYAAGRFEDLPVLADLLEEAGLTDAELLGHLRGPGPHVLGCHALDAVLGKT